MRLLKTILVLIISSLILANCGINLETKNKSQDSSKENLEEKLILVSSELPLLEKELIIYELIEQNDKKITSQLIKSQYSNAMNLYYINLNQLDELELVEMINRKKITGDKLLTLIKEARTVEVFISLYNTYLKENTEPSAFFKSGIFQNTNNDEVYERMALDTKNNITVEEFLIEKGNEKVITSIVSKSKHESVLNSIINKTKNDPIILKEFMNNSNVSILQCREIIRNNSALITQNSDAEILDSINKNNSCKNTIETCTYTEIDKDEPYNVCDKGNIFSIKKCYKLYSENPVRLYFMNEDKKWIKYNETYLVNNDSNCSKEFPVGLKADSSNPRIGQNQIKIEIFNPNRSAYEEDFWRVVTALKIN
jgi:hypothetical protein